jgi:hypothetical protein
MSQLPRGRQGKYAHADVCWRSNVGQYVGRAGRRLLAYYTIVQAMQFTLLQSAGIAF